jgi:hypothetical protein
MLGHSTITQTMDTYSHVLPDMQEGAVMAMEEAMSSEEDPEPREQGS